jgi:hypothetical protein
MSFTSAHERLLIILVALHTLIIGLVFLTVPDWAVNFGGWPQNIRPIFFGYQVGIFHVVLVCGYLIEYFRYRGISLIITAKSIALVFLLITPLFHEVPWAVPVSGVVDGAMALVVWQVHRAVNPDRAQLQS